ncbi:MAG: hypothetical protein LBG80_08685, partial [Bacteroidales bacterium]|nr:hypothetical protein [Bacteroidales bacterium]
GAGIRANYRDLRVNTDNICLDGVKWKTIRTSGFIADMDVITDVINTITDATALKIPEDTVKLNFTVSDTLAFDINCSIDTACAITVIGDNGETETIIMPKDSNGNIESLPITVTDNAGNEYEINNTNDKIVVEKRSNEKIDTVPKRDTLELKEDILLDKDNNWWVHQFDEPLFGMETCWKNQCCNRAANKILNNAGISTSRAQQIVIVKSNNSECGDIVMTDIADFNKAIRIIDTSLKKHELPIMVGVHHPKKIETPNGTTWQDNCSGNIPAITNHYIVIRGKRYDSDRGQYYYLFYEVGTSISDNGTSTENKLYIDETKHIIKGETKYIKYMGYYTVTEVRKNNNQTY